MHRILHEAPLPDRIIELDSTLAEIVQRALERDPDRRYQDASSLARDVAQVRRRLGESGARDDGRGSRVSVFERREPGQEQRFRIRPSRLAEMGGEAGDGGSESGTTSEPPIRLREFEIHEVLGEGGMGVVYRATEVKRRRAAAIKVLRPDMRDSPLARARFEREASVLRALRHPAIVELFASGEEDGQPYFAMELIQGLSVKRLLRNVGRLNADVAGAIASMLADAFHHVHERGFVRSDVSPRNVIVTDQGDVRVIDLGIAKQEAVEEGLTRVGVFVGTPSYLSPEAWMGTPLDARADVYALGVTLYEMVTGVLPFQAASRAEMMTAHVHRDPMPPSRLAPMPQALNAIILRCLQKDRELRYATMADLREALPRVDASACRQRLKALVDAGRQKVEAGSASTVFLDPGESAQARGSLPAVASPVPGTVRAPAGAQHAMVFRVIEGGLDAGRDIALPGRRAIIGRDELADIILLGTKVSRWHAALLLRDGEYWIEDLNSHNGVFVNREAISAPRKLEPGDHVLIGEYWLQFVAASPNPSALDVVVN